MLILGADRLRTRRRPEKLTVILSQIFTFSQQKSGDVALSAAATRSSDVPPEQANGSSPPQLQQRPRARVREPAAEEEPHGGKSRIEIESPK